MALPSRLSGDALARFRTKHCERLLAVGHCVYGDKCQYSHDSAWLRRNPHKYRYSAQLCSNMKLGFCVNGACCEYSHSKDEQLYHPDVYKRTRCLGAEQCEGYYCPFVHSETDDPPSRLSSWGATRKSVCKKGECVNVALKCEPDWRESTGSQASTQEIQGEPMLSPMFEVDEYLQVSVPCNGIPNFADPYGFAGNFARFVKGRLRGKNFGPQIDCHVKVMTSGRKECAEAAKVVKQMKRWMLIPQADGSRRFLDLKRTLATIYLALPVDQGSLKHSVVPLNTDQAIPLVIDLVADLQRLHATGTAHWCISPQAVITKPNSAVCLGDFLCKIRAMYLLRHGWDEAVPTSIEKASPTAPTCASNACGRNWAWSMWYPPEFHATVASRSAYDINCQDALGSDRFAVDAWQLGVTVFYLLTGEHMYGCHQHPESVCRNIVAGEKVNLRLIEKLPFFGHFCKALTAQKPCDRARAPDLLRSLPGSPLLADVELGKFSQASPNSVDSQAGESGQTQIVDSCHKEESQQVEERELSSGIQTMSTCSRSSSLSSRRSSGISTAYSPHPNKAIVTTAEAIEPTFQAPFKEAQGEWRCTWEGGLLIRLKPDLDVTSRKDGIVGYLETFYVSEKLEKEVSGITITFLKLADGRGWVLDCNHAEDGQRFSAFDC